MPGYLRPHIVSRLPAPTDPRYRKDINQAGEPGWYWVEFTFQANPRLTGDMPPAALREEFIGDSLLQISEPLPSPENRKRVFTLKARAKIPLDYFFFCNKIGRLSHVNVRLQATNFDEAIKIARDNIQPFLAGLSVRFNVPIILFRIRALEEGTNVARCVIYHQLYGPRKADTSDFNRQLWFPGDHRTLVFYQDALNATNPKHQFLCFYKVIELVLALRAKRASIEKGRDAKILRRKEILPDEDWFKPHLDAEVQSKLTGKKFTAIRDYVLRPIRNRIAHGFLDDASPADQISDDEVYRYLPVAKLMAERLLTSELSPVAIP